MSLISRFLTFVLLCASALDAAENLSPLAPAPDWSQLEQFQETITHDEFQKLLSEIYCARGVSADLLRVEADSVRVLENKDAQSWFALRFAKTPEAKKPIKAGWRSPKILPPSISRQPLAGLRVALDPGHIGGAWAKMEERWFRVDHRAPVREGNMTLRVAKILAPKLRALGATVSLLRAQNEPLTTHRPNEFSDLARSELVKSSIENPPEDFAGPADPNKEQSVRWHSEVLFYRNSEIRARAALVNDKLHPDFVVCLHFNAEAWGDPKQPTLVDKNHMHLLANGAYLDAELAFDDVRFEMMRKILTRTSDTEIPLVDAVAAIVAQETLLSSYQYSTDNVTRVGSSGYIYARNLMANRIYNCPVIYCEPYVMNGREAFERIQLGDYKGKRRIRGVARRSIYREYAQSVADGLAKYFRETRALQ